MAVKPQFSLRLLFVMTAAAALIAGEAVAFSDAIAEVVGVAFTALIFPAAVLSIIYAPGASRAFGNGALLFWFSAGWIVFLGRNKARLYRNDFCVWWSMALAGRVAAVIVWWFVQPRSGVRV
jgi:hypothetical protein